MIQETISSVDIKDFLTAKNERPAFPITWESKGRFTEDVEDLR